MILEEYIEIFFITIFNNNLKKLLEMQQVLV